MSKIKRQAPTDFNIPLQSKAVLLNNGQYALVDEEDYEKIMKQSWHIDKGYVVARIGYKNVKMHRFIMQVNDPKVFVDHMHHNPLDNRKSQLRVCNNSQNQANSRASNGRSSKYKGVSLIRETNKWKSRIMCNGIHYRMGHFETEEDAARAYDEKAKELFGEFAYLNFNLKGSPF